MSHAQVEMKKKGSLEEKASRMFGKGRDIIESFKDVLLFETSKNFVDT